MVNELRLTVYAGEELDEIPCRFQDRGRRLPPLHGPRTACARRRRHSHRRGHRAARRPRADGAYVHWRRSPGATPSSSASATRRGSSSRSARPWREVGGYPRLVRRRQRDGDLTCGCRRPSGPLAGATRQHPAHGAGLEGLAPRLATARPSCRFAPAPTTVHAVSRHRHTTQLRAAIALPVRVGGRSTGVLVACSSDAHAFDSSARRAARGPRGRPRLRPRAHPRRSRAGRESGARARAQRNDSKASSTRRSTRSSCSKPCATGTGPSSTSIRRGQRGRAGLQRASRYDRADSAACSPRCIPTFGSGRASPSAIMDVVETGEPVILDDYSYANPNVGDHDRRYDIRAAQCGDGVTLTWRDVTDEVPRRPACSRESEHRYRSPHRERVPTSSGRRQPTARWPGCPSRSPVCSAGAPTSCSGDRPSRSSTRTSATVPRHSRDLALDRRSRCATSSGFSPPTAATAGWPCPRSSRTATGAPLRHRVPARHPRGGCAAAPGWSTRCCTTRLTGLVNRGEMRRGSRLALDCRLDGVHSGAQPGRRRAVAGQRGPRPRRRRPCRWPS